jgi:hypothetical protein
MKMSKWYMYSYRNWNNEFNSCGVPAIIQSFNKFNFNPPLARIGTKKVLKNWLFL